MIGRREFITLLGGAAAWPVAARAQPGVLPIVGLLGVGSPESEAFRFAAFREGLSAAGFVDGRNVTIESRWAQNQPDKLTQFASEFARRPVALIAAVGTTAALAAQAATTTIPVVFTIGGDPVSLGLVSSLARSGLARSSQRRGVTPFVLLLKRVGNSCTKSGTVVRFSNSE